MAFDRTFDGGKKWALPRGADRDLMSLIRYRSNHNVVELAALVRAVETQVPALAAESALSLSFGSLRATPPGVLSRLVRHPSFTYWISVVKHLLRVEAGIETLRPGMVETSSVDQLLRKHLDDLQRYAVAAGIIASDAFSTTFRHPHDGPLIFPTTGIAVEGVTFNQEIQIDVESEGKDCRIQLSQAERFIDFTTDQPWALREVPVVVVRAASGMKLLPVYRVNGGMPGYELDPWDPYFRLAWVRNETFPDQVTAPMASEGDLGHWHVTLQAAMGLLTRHHPPFASEISAMVSSLVPISSSDSAKSLSVTAPEFWGAIQCSIDPAAMMGEVLVHEYRHNLLHVLNDLDPIFLHESPVGDRFYSPWRDDGRPLLGLLHALFTFLGVVTYYRALLSGDELTPQNRRAASRRAAAHTKRLELGAKEFEKARLTDFGHGFFAGLREGIDDASEFARTLDSQQVSDAVDSVLRHAAARGVAPA